MANTENFAAFINDVINLLRSGAKDHIVEIMRSFTVPSEYYLTADDAKKLFAQLVVNKTEPKIRPTKSYEDAYNTAKSKFFINPDKQANTYYTDDKYGSKGFDLRGEWIPQHKETGKLPRGRLPPDIKTSKDLDNYLIKQAEEIYKQFPEARKKKKGFTEDSKKKSDGDAKKPSKK